MDPWREIIKLEIIPQIIGDQFWESYLINAVNHEMSHVGIHLAIFIEPYLSYIITGKKTVESRFGVRRIAPYGKVANGDIILLKESGGPVIGICKVSNVWFYQLSTESWGKLREKFAKPLCAQDPKFWEDRESAEFATLMQISDIKELQPVDYTKKDRRGWVVLRPPLVADRLYL